MKIYIENYKQIQKPGENNKSAIHRLQPLMLKTALADFPFFSGSNGFPVLQERTPAGKPYLPSHPDFHYNFSDSGDYLVLAVSPKHEIGVDLQKLTPVRAGVISMAERFFHPEDLALLRNAKDAEEQLKLFFRIWTIKEAYLKCTGEGLSGGLNRLPRLPCSISDRRTPVSGNGSSKGRLCSDRLRVIDHQQPPSLT